MSESDPVLTLAERERVRVYDERCQRQIEATQRPPIRPDFIQDLCEALEDEALDQIREIQEEIGTLMQCRETFKERASVEPTDVLIWQLRYKMEENHRDVQRWRSYQSRAV